MKIKAIKPIHQFLNLFLCASLAFSPVVLKTECGEEKLSPASAFLAGQPLAQLKPISFYSVRFPYVWAHEFGHWAVAKWFGLQVESLSFSRKNPHVRFTQPPTNQQAVRIYQGARAAQMLLALFAAAGVAVDRYLHADPTLLSLICGALLLSGLIHLYRSVSVEAPTSDQANSQFARLFAHFFPNERFITAQFNMDQGDLKKMQYIDNSIDFLTIIQKAKREGLTEYEGYQTYLSQLKPNSIHQPFPLSIEELDKKIQYYTNPENGFENQRGLTQAEFEFYFVELITQLKALGDGWSVDKHWVHPNHLCRTLIWRYFKQRLSRWEQFPVFGDPANREANARHTFTRLLANFYKVEKIGDFDCTDRTLFHGSNEPSEADLFWTYLCYEVILGKDKRFRVWLKGSKLTREDLQGTNLEEESLKPLSAAEVADLCRRYGHVQLRALNTWEASSTSMFSRTQRGTFISDDALQRWGWEHSSQPLRLTSANSPSPSRWSYREIITMFVTVFFLTVFPLYSLRHLRETFPKFLEELTMSFSVAGFLTSPFAALMGEFGLSLAFLGGAVLLEMIRLYVRVKIRGETTAWTGLALQLTHFSSGVRARTSRVRSALSETLRQLHPPAAAPDISL